jgi:hypothetical protein
MADVPQGPDGHLLRQEEQLYFASERSNPS